MKHAHVYLSLATSMLFSGSVATAASLWVDPADPAAYATIQDAVDDASDGDTIYIETTSSYTDTDGDGYVVRIDGISLTLVSADLSSRYTLDGQNSAQGILVTDASLDLNNANIVDCTASEGGGIEVEVVAGGSVSIMECSFDNCSATVYGGALLIEGRSASPAEAQVVFCDFNNCSSAQYGGGIYNINSSLYVLAANFTECAGYRGAALYNSKASLVMEQVQFESNDFSQSSSISGYVVELGTQTSSSQFLTCSFHENGNCTATSASGALIYRHAGDLEVSDCSFTDNCELGKGCIYLGEADPSNTATISYCEFSGNASTSAFGYSVLNIMPTAGARTLEYVTMCDHAANREISGSYTDGGQLSIGGWCCPGDIDDDGDVDADDLSDLVSNWTSSLGEDDRQDCTRDDSIDMADLLTLLNAWGSCA